MDIWEKLARCETSGEVQRMCRGTGWTLVEADEIKRLKQALADAHGLLVSYGKWAAQSKDLAHDAELHFSVYREELSVREDDDD